MRLSVQDSDTAGVPLLARVTLGSGTGGALLSPASFTVSRAEERTALGVRSMTGYDETATMDLYGRLSSSPIWWNRIHCSSLTTVRAMRNLL